VLFSSGDIEMPWSMMDGWMPVWTFFPNPIPVMRSPKRRRVLEKKANDERHQLSLILRTGNRQSTGAGNLNFRSRLMAQIDGSEHCESTGADDLNRGRLAPRMIGNQTSADRTRKRRLIFLVKTTSAIRSFTPNTLSATAEDVRARRQTEL
jgi:hypothetical protein